MQVNNNPSTQNFGMALKITKGSEEFLKKQSIETLNKLGKIGEEMKGYKFWDLKLTKDGFIAEPSKTDVWFKHGSFKNDFSVERYDNGSFLLKSTYASTAEKDKPARMLISSSCADFETEKGNFNKVNILDKFVAAVRLLEKNSAKEAEEEALKATRIAVINAKTNDLMSKFGVDA